MFWKLKLYLNKVYSCFFTLSMSRYVDIDLGSNCDVHRVRKDIHGNSNSIIIGNAVSINNCFFYIKGSSNKIIIKNRVRSSFLTFWIEGDNNNIIVGEDCIFGQHCQLAACEGTDILIGSNCMFSHDVFVRTTDSHPIFNVNCIRINKAKSIHIDNHVWVGMQCLILKGSHIGSDSIVGARAMVSSSLENSNNSMICGMPARIIKSGVNWDKSFF